MNNAMVRFAMAAAAVLVVAIVGFNLMSTNGTAGPPTASTLSSAGPSAAVSPSPRPSARPSPSPTLAGERLYRTPPGFLDAGVYVVDQVVARPFTITVPAYWSGLEHSSGNALLVKTEHRGAFGTVRNTALLGFYAVDGVYDNPCLDAAPASLGPTSAAKFIQALSHSVGVKIGKVTDTTIGGLPAKLVEVSNSIDGSKCTTQPFSLWTFRFGTSSEGNGTSDGGGHQRIWLLDMKGQVLLINGQASTFDGSPKADIDELDAIVSSITFH